MVSELRDLAVTYSRLCHRRLNCRCSRRLGIEGL